MLKPADVSFFNWASDNLDTHWLHVWRRFNLGLFMTMVNELFTVFTHVNP